MKIGIVADTFSVEAGTGIARYSREMLTGLSKLGLRVRPFHFPSQNIPLEMTINHALKMPYTLARQAGSFDLIHAVSPICALGFLLLRGPARVITYHDLTSLLCQDTSSAFHTRLFAPLFLRVGKLADRVIADSSQTKEEMIVHLGISEDKITVVNLGVDDKFVPARKALRDHHVIGYVGALSRRKRIDYLLRAFHILKKKHAEIPVRLVVCGSKRLEYPALVKLAAELNVSGDVEFTGFVAEDALVETYHSFDVFVLPSEWEGFGLPVLEAQRCGVPVVVRESTNIPCEVSKACLKAHSEEDMASTIYALLSDQTVRSQTIAEGLTYSRQFTWQQTVIETLGVYREAVKDR
jgi:glycosyltransferase involved in cell wall biosynthesis